MRFTFFPTFAGALCLGAVCVWQATAPADDAVPDVPNGAVQARGPVHEAYAEPAETRPEAGPIIPKQPPEPIQEQPPDQKPAGDSIVWIPGYWAWDDETTDFTWISGFWRDPPPGRVWTPGHWQEADGGWQWVAGLWAAQNAQEVEYLPPPPPSIDNGPSIPATDESSAYVPGCWVYRETRYLWRPGYWVEANPNWCWIPDHYSWTPAGYLFVGGYWDYPLESRGLLFAPVRFERRVYEERDFVYTPEYVIQPDFLLGALFVRPAYCHYYFGDYFEDRYENRGFTSWVDYRVGRHSYDPNFAFYRRRYRDDDHWETSLRDLYALRRSGDVPRPPRTLIQQTQIVNNITINKTENVAINKNIQITNIQSVTALTPINQAENVKVTGLSGLTGIPVKVRSGDVAAAIPAPRAIKLEPVSKERQAEVKTHVMQMHQFAAAQQKEQAKIVSAGAMPLKPTDRPKTVKVEMPRDPGKPAKPGIERNVPVPPPTPKNEPPLQSAPARVRTPTPGVKEPPPVLRKEPPLSPAKEPPILPRKEPPPVKEPPLPPRESPAVPVRKEPPPPPAQKTPPPLPPRESPPVPVRKELPPPPPVQKAPPPLPPRESPPVPAHKEPPPAPVRVAPPPPPPVHKEPPPAPVRAAPPSPPPPPPPPVHKEPPPPTKEPPKGKSPQTVSAQRK